MKFTLSEALASGQPALLNGAQWPPAAAQRAVTLVLLLLLLLRAAAGRRDVS